MVWGYHQCLIMKEVFKEEGFKFSTTLSLRTKQEFSNSGKRVLYSTGYIMNL